MNASLDRNCSIFLHDAICHESQLVSTSQEELPNAVDENHDDFVAVEDDDEPSAPTLLEERWRELSKAYLALVSHIQPTCMRPY